MTEEALVLHRHDPAQERRVGPIEVRPNPPAPVLHRQSPQPLPPPVQRYRAGPPRPGEIRGGRRVQNGDGSLDREERDQSNGEAAKEMVFRIVTLDPPS